MTTNDDMGQVRLLLSIELAMAEAIAGDAADGYPFALFFNEAEWIVYQRKINVYIRHLNVLNGIPVQQVYADPTVPEGCVLRATKAVHDIWLEMFEEE